MSIQKLSKFIKKGVLKCKNKSEKVISLLFEFKEIVSRMRFISFVVRKFDNVFSFTII